MFDIVKRAASDENIRLDDMNDTPDNLSSDIVAAVDGASIEAADPIIKDNEIIVPMPNVRTQRRCANCGNRVGDGG